MSQLLDALKQSDQRRQKLKLRSAVESGQTIIPTSSSQVELKSPRWPWLVAVLLVGSAVGGVWLLGAGLFGSPLMDVEAKEAELASASGPLLSDPSAEKLETVTEVLPRVTQLSDQIAKQLPALAFTQHEFAAEDHLRRVVINGRLLQEGDAIVPGLLLEIISPDGVVLDYSGVRFRMLALEQWPSADS